ncbi:hypothetical protein MRX96_026831 [Rhipicephalus microplus]
MMFLRSLPSCSLPCSAQVAVVGRSRLWRLPVGLAASVGASASEQGTSDAPEWLCESFTSWLTADKATVGGFEEQRCDMACGVDSP